MAVVRVSWMLPIEEKTYIEIGKLMTLLLPLTKRIVVADSEGVLLEVDKELLEELKEDVKELRLRYVEIGFEEEEEE